MNTHRPALTLGTLLSTGIILGSMFPYFWVWGVGCCVALGFRRVFIATVCIGAVIIIAHTQPMPRPVGVLKGIVISQVQAQTWGNGYKHQFQMKLPQGIILVDDLTRTPLKYGDEIQFYGKAHSVPGSYGRYLRNQGIFWVITVAQGKKIIISAQHRGNVFKEAALSAKAFLQNHLQKQLNPKAYGVMQALVLGDRSAMPKDVEELFRRTGTSHVLAISGMNMAIVAAMIVFILRLTMMPRRIMLAFAIIVLGMYTFITGASPSIVRAWVMVSVVLASFIFEEDCDALNSLGVAALILLCADPRVFWDIGFQLSFVSVLAILIAAKPLEEKMACLPDFIAMPLSVSAVAWAANAPLIAFYFSNITPIAIVANLFIVPLMDVLMFLGVLLGLLGNVTWIANSLSGLIEAILAIAIITCQSLSQIPGGYCQWGI